MAKTKTSTSDLTGQPAPPRFHAVLDPAGLHFPAPADTPLLLAAEQAGIDMPSSCRNGTCRTCIALLTAGQVGYRIDWPGLSAEEKAQGWILPCVAYPLSDVAVQQI